MLRTRFGERAKISPQTQYLIESGNIFRASGRCVCLVCDKPYWKHCALEEPYEFLVLLCNGDVVKL